MVRWIFINTPMIFMCHKNLIASFIFGLSFASHAMALATSMPATIAPTYKPVVKHLPIEDIGQVNQIVNQFNQLAESIITNGNVVGLATTVVYQNKVLSSKGYGKVDVRGNIHITPDTPFRFASLSKSFAATLAAMLERDGYFEWDDSVQDLVPMLKLSNAQQAKKLTIEEVLSHRVGLPYNTFDKLIERNEPYPLLVQKLQQIPLTCEVGQCYAYQNVAFSLIGDITFATTGEFYSFQVEKRLFHPLDMLHATFGRTALETEVYAKPHIRTAKGWVSVIPKDTYYHVTPAAGINASINDLSKWLLAHLGQRPDVIPADMLKLLHTPTIRTPGELNSSLWRRERVRDAYYALGWRVFDYAGHQLIFHAGAVQGYRGIMAILPEYNVGIGILWNCESTVPSGLFPTILDAFFDLPKKQWVVLPHS